MAPMQDELARLLEEDPALYQEVATLSPAHRQEALEAIVLRRRARQLGEELGLDADEVEHQLRQLRRTPVERLRLGLRHGRARPPVS